MQYYRQNVSRIAAASLLRAFNGAIDEAASLDGPNGKQVMARLAQSIERNTIYYDGNQQPYLYQPYFNLIQSALNVFKSNSKVLEFLSLSGIDVPKLKTALSKYWSVRARFDSEFFPNQLKKNLTASQAQSLYRLIEDWEISVCEAIVALNRGPQRVGCCPGLEARILKNIGFTEASKKHAYSMSAAVAAKIDGLKRCKTPTTGGGKNRWMDAGPVKYEPEAEYVPSPEGPPQESGVPTTLLLGGAAVALFAVVMLMNKKKATPSRV